MVQKARNRLKSGSPFSVEFYRFTVGSGTAAAK